MEFKTGYLYHWISAIIYIMAGGYVLFNPTIFPREFPGMRLGIGVLLILWGGFRAVNGFLLWKKKQQQNNE